MEALKENPENENKEFILNYQVDENIIGGLQMYTESKFIDMSIQSRMEKVKLHMGKILQ